MKKEKASSMTQEEVIRLKEHVQAYKDTPIGNIDVYKCTSNQSSDRKQYTYNAQTMSSMIGHTIHTLHGNLPRLVGDMNAKEALQFIRDLQGLRDAELSLLKNPNE